MNLNIHKKNIKKIGKILISRIGSMVIFSGITSVIIFFVTMNDNLDELANNITGGNVAKFASNILDDQSSLSPVMAPMVKKIVITDTQPIPFATEQEFSPYLDEGQTLVYPGQVGQMVTQYEHVMVNGKLMNVNKLSDDIIRPRAQKILIGVRKPIVFEQYANKFNLDENGCPTNYLRVLPNKVATAISINKVL